MYVYSSIVSLAINLRGHPPDSYRVLVSNSEDRFQEELRRAKIDGGRIFNQRIDVSNIRIVSSTIVMLNTTSAAIRSMVMEQ